MPTTTWSSRRNAIYGQLAAQVAFIVISFPPFGFFGQQRPLWLPVSGLAFSLALDYFCACAQNQRYSWIRGAGVAAVANSVYLNLEFFGAGFWSLYVCLLLAMLGKLFLRVRGRAIFNASVLALSLGPLLIPAYVGPAAGLWKGDPRLVYLVLFTGVAVSLWARMASVAFSYIAGRVLGFILLVGTAWFFRSPYQNVPLLLACMSTFRFPSLLMAFHVITDPVSGPVSGAGKIAFGAALGVFDSLAFILGWFGMPFYLVLMLAHSRWVPARDF